MNYQFCFCNAQPGYPHAADCPYPLYNGSDADEKQWVMARTRKRMAMHTYIDDGYDEGIEAARVGNTP